MNQILSVDMPKHNNRRKIKGENKKASTKSVVLFFCIVLVVFGLALVGIGVFAMTNSPKEVTKPQTVDVYKPRIDVTQNATELEIEISGENEISKIEYSWEDGEKEQIEGNGTNLLETSIVIPSGTKTLNLIVTDINGNTTNYSKEFVGPNELESVQLTEAEGNKIKVLCQETKQISYISYFYDNEAENRQEVNGSNQAEIEIATKEGEHLLTIKVGFADGTVAQKSSKLYVPTATVTTDGNNFMISAQDKRNITKVTMNFNGQESQEDVNSQNFEKTLPLQNGENRLILTVYNADGGKIMKKIRWEKK